MSCIPLGPPCCRFGRMNAIPDSSSDEAITSPVSCDMLAASCGGKSGASSSLSEISAFSDILKPIGNHPSSSNSSLTEKQDPVPCANKRGFKTPRSRTSKVPTTLPYPEDAPSASICTGRKCRRLDVQESLVLTPTFDEVIGSSISSVPSQRLWSNGVNHGLLYLNGYTASEGLEHAQKYAGWIQDIMSVPDDWHAVLALTYPSEVVHHESQVSVAQPHWVLLHNNGRGVP